jgi:hypothetical protein
MEPLQPAAAEIYRQNQSIRRGRLLRAASLTMVLLTGIPGCLPDSFLIDPAKTAAAPCQISTRWGHVVQFPPDPVNNGKPTPTIAGRVYLFGKDLTTPIRAEGVMMIKLYDDSPEAVNKEEVLEAWLIDPSNLKKFERRDAAGWGYTVVLPWGTYRPDLKNVRIQVRFDITGGKDALYSGMTPLTFENDSAPKVQIAHKHTGPIVPINGALYTPAPNAPPVENNPLEPNAPREPSITLSPAAPVADVPFIVPKAGAQIPANQP